MELLSYILILFLFFRLVKVLGFISVDEKVGKFHHFYLGILFFVVSNIICQVNPVLTSTWIIGCFMGILGLWLMGDDLYQHWRHAQGDLAYQSFIHKLGIPLYEFRSDLIKNHPWWKWLNKF